MKDEPSSPAEDQPDFEATRSGRRVSGWSRAGRLGLGLALVVAAVVASGAVAQAVGGDSSGDRTTDHRRDDHGDGHRHEPLPPYEERYQDASVAEQAAADALLAELRASLVAYEDAAAAVGAGYQPPRRPRGRLTHYVNPSVGREGQVLHPSRPNGLVYYTGGAGSPVLLGAFFIAPPGTEAPTPAGDLLVWHSHNSSCPGFFATAAAPCTDTRRMVHVWTVDQVEILARRSGQPVEVQVTDPFGAPFRAAVRPAE